MDYIDTPEKQAERSGVGIAVGSAGAIRSEGQPARAVIRRPTGESRNTNAGAMTRR